MVIKRFEDYLVRLDPTVGSEIQKTRPCLVISPDEMNRFISTIIHLGDESCAGNPRRGITRKAMNKTRSVVLQACVAFGLVTLFSFTAIAAPRLDQPTAGVVVSFDVSDLPARIDEPRLSKIEKDFVIDCAVANRSSEQLLGIRLVLLVIDPAGKLRSRVTWIERAELAMYSIKIFAFHPPITGEIRKSDQLFLVIDEVIGRETIWRAAGAEKALRAYSRGQHDLMPSVKAFANKYDSPPGMVVLPPIQRKQ